MRRRFSISCRFNDRQYRARYQSATISHRTILNANPFGRGHGSGSLRRFNPGDIVAPNRCLQRRKNRQNPAAPWSRPHRLDTRPQAAAIVSSSTSRPKNAPTVTGSFGTVKPAGCPLFYTHASAVTRFLGTATAGGCDRDVCMSSRVVGLTNSIRSRAGDG